MKKSILFVVAFVILIDPSWRNRAFSQTSSSTRLMVVDLPSTTARVVTDLGVQSSVFKGQIAFQQTIGPKGVISTKIESFNFVGMSVRTNRGPSGPLGLALRTGSAGAVQVNGTTLSANLELVAHYSLIDRLKGFKRNAADDFSALTEAFRGKYEATLSQPPNMDLTTTLIDGRVRVVLADAVLGGILAIDLDFLAAPIQSTPIGSCNPGMRRLTIQPVFFRNRPGALLHTGRSLATLRNRAEAIWSRACVVFEFLEPIISDNADYRIIETSQKMLDAVDLVPAIVDENGRLSGIAVLFIESATFGDWDGGRTYAGGTERARIVVADDNLNSEPPSENVLAHEIGHALSLCHPGDGACIREEARNPGSRGTVMCLSGLEADNPDVQSEQNANNVSNPLLFHLALIRCCFRTDCANNLDCGRCP